jgi:hypothetical protein
VLRNSSVAASGEADFERHRNLTDDARLTHVLPLQRSVRDFLKKRTSYDVLPLSFRLIILNTDLLVKQSLNILLQNGPSPLLPLHRDIVSATLVLTPSKASSRPRCGIRIPPRLRGSSLPRTTSMSSSTIGRTPTPSARSTSFG